MKTQSTHTGLGKPEARATWEPPPSLQLLPEGGLVHSGALAPLMPPPPAALSCSSDRAKWMHCVPGPEEATVREV